MRVAIGADWVGIELKTHLAGLVKELGHEVMDMGGDTGEANDYPDFAEKVGSAVATGAANCGILICGTGIGMSIAANKVKGVRAALCHDAFTVVRSREHNDANVLALGAWVVSPPHAKELVELWLRTPFAAGRHVPRLEKISSLEGQEQIQSKPRPAASGEMPLKTSIALSPTIAKFAPLFCAGNLRRGMELAAHLGYNGVELNLRDSDQLDQDAIVAWSQELGLSVPSIGTGQSFFTDGLSLANPDPEVQKAIQERMRGHVRFAARLGARVVLGSVRGKLDTTSPTTQQASFEAALQATRTLADYAASVGVSLTIEPINRYETNLLNSVAESLEFIEALGALNIGVTADTFHMNIEEISIANSLLQAGDRLWHVHLVDSNRRAVGMGHIEFASVIAILRQINYQGYLSAEVIPWPDDETAGRHWIDATQQLLKG